MSEDWVLKALEINLKGISLDVPANTFNARKLKKAQTQEIFTSDKLELANIPQMKIISQTVAF